MGAVQGDQLAVVEGGLPHGLKQAAFLGDPIHFIEHVKQTLGLDRVERLGNALPDPTTLFLIGAVLVVVLSQVAAGLEWTVEKTVTREVVDAQTGAASRERVSVLPGPPALYQSILAHPDRESFDLSCLRLAVTGQLGDRAAHSLDVTRRQQVASLARQHHGVLHDSHRAVDGTLRDDDRSLAAVG